MIQPGRIIQISDKKGAVIKATPDSLISFADGPSFFDINPQLHQFQEVGHINDKNYQNLKNELLKYYHQHKDQNNEGELLKDLMYEAFPNGIPEEKESNNPHLPVQPLKEDVEYLESGCQIKVKCPKKSSLSFLNGEVLDIVDVDSKGLKVLKKESNSKNNKYYTIFYKKPGYDNSLAGIDYIEVIKKHNNLDDSLREQIKSIKGKEDFTSQIIDENGNIYDVNPSTLGVTSLDGKKKGLYSPSTDEIKIISASLDQSNQDDDDDEDDEGIYFPNPLTKGNEKDKNLREKFSLAGLDLDEDISSSEEETEEETEESENQKTKRRQMELLEGGSKKKEEDDQEDESMIEFESGIDLKSLEDEEEELEIINSKLSKSESDDYLDNDQSDSEDYDYDYEDFDIIDEPVELSEVIFKSKRVPVPDEKKIYEPQIQKSEFFKFLLEKLVPNKQLRKNKYITDQVHKITNRLTDLKDELINNKDDPNLFKEKYQPLVESYLNGDYRSKFLIPIVLNKKKLYFKGSSDYHYEFYQKNSNIIHQNYLDVIGDLITRVDQKNSSKISSLTYFQLEKAINEMTKPYKINDDSNIIGNIDFVTSQVPDDQLPFDDYSGLAVRYNRDPFKNQGVDFQESDIESHTLRSPIIYFQETLKAKTDEELDKEEDELLMAEDPEQEWQHEERMEESFKNNPKFKKIIEGDHINLMGYLSLPLKYALDRDNIYKTTIQEIYNQHKELETIKEIDLEKDKDQIKDNILKYRSQPTFFYFPENKQTLKNEQREYLEKLVPNFEEICRYHKKEFEECQNWTQIENIIQHYGYKLRNLNIDDWMVLSEILENKVSSDVYKLSKRWLDYQKFLEHNQSKKENNVRNFSMVNKMILQDLENYYGEYPSSDVSIDSDTTRLAWTFHKSDHGKLLELLLNKNQLIEEQRTLNRGEIDKQLLNAKNDLKMLEDRYSREIKMTDYNQETCNEKPDYQVVKKYTSIKDLENDNYKNAKADITNKPIEQGQYCVLNDKENKIQKVYVRKELPNQYQVWEESSLKFEQLEELVKTECQSGLIDRVREMTKGNECQFQEDTTSCFPGHIDSIYRKLKSQRDLVKILEAELVNIDRLDKRIKNVEKEISKTRSFLGAQRNLERLERENRIATYQQIINDVKKAKLHKKDCPHYQVINYFFRMKHITENERYKLSKMILDKFQDLTPSFFKYLAQGEESESKTDDFEMGDYGRFDMIHENEKLNWSYCSLCHQKLLCNHYLYVNQILAQTNELDEKLLKDLYGLEIDQNYGCRVCGEHLVSGEDIDMDGFVKKADKNDQRMITREIIDQEIERKGIQKNILDEMLYEVDSRSDDQSKDMKIFLTCIQVLKSLTRIDLMSQDQEEIISYIKSFPFLTREYFKEYLKQNMKISNTQLLEYQANQFFLRFAIYDITSRFLIVLQTSEMTYSLSNELCRGHLGGYPLGQITDLTTVNYFSCILEKMSALHDFNFLAKEQNINARFISRLKIQAQNQKVQYKYHTAIERKAQQIFHEDPFAKNPTNFWIDFRPCLGKLDVNWTPKKTINSKAVHKIITDKYDQFSSDLRMNLSNLASKIFDNALNIISKEDPSVTYHKIVKLGNSCCLTQLKSNQDASYYGYLYHKEPQLKSLVEELNALDNLKLQLERKVQRVGPPPSFMKVDQIFQFDPYYHINQPYILSDDIKTKLFLTFVDQGINRGRYRIFNPFGICTLSGDSKQHILSRQYSDQEYYDLLNDVQNRGLIELTKPVDLELRQLIASNLNKYIESNKLIHENQDEFLYKFLNNLKELLLNKDTLVKDFNQHWSKLDQEINSQVEKLAHNLQSVKKDTQIKEKLHRLGDYRKIYQEEDMAYVNSAPKEQQPELFKEANKKRFLRLEKNIKNYIFNFFRATLAKIKNNGFDKHFGMEINEQWKELIDFRNNRKLFKDAFNVFNQLTQNLELINGTQFEHFDYNKTSNLFKCIMFIILNKMIEIQPKKKETFKSQFITKTDQEELDLELDHKEDDLRNFNLQKFSDQKVIILYVHQILDKIFKEEQTFDQLTQSNMTIIENRKREERNRKNLKLMAILASDGQKDLRRVIMDQKRLGLIDYEDFADILQENIDAGEDKPQYDRDMEILDQLNNDENIQGHIVEEKLRDKLIDYQIEEDEFSYVAGEDDDIEDF